MGLFGRGEVPTVGARAFVVPGQTVNVGENVNNTAHAASAKTRFLLDVHSTADGRPGPAGTQRHQQSTPNWIRLLCESAGTNDELGASLPAEVHLPVLVHASERRVVRIDMDLAATELEPYREIVRAWWLRTEAPLADVRGAIAFPKEATRFGRDLLSSWGKGLRDLRDDLRAEGSAGVGKERDPVREEEIRRTAVQLKYRFERHPKEWHQVRASVERAAPMLVQGVRDGRVSGADLEEFLILHGVSGVISAEEEVELRRQAAAPEPGGVTPPRCGPEPPPANR